MSGILSVRMAPHYPVRAGAVGMALGSCKSRVVENESPGIGLLPVFQKNV